MNDRLNVKDTLSKQRSNDVVNALHVIQSLKIHLLLNFIAYWQIFDIFYSNLLESILELKSSTHNLFQKYTHSISIWALSLHFLCLKILQSYKISFRIVFRSIQKQLKKSKLTSAVLHLAELRNFRLFFQNLQLNFPTS